MWAATPSAGASTCRRTTCGASAAATRTCAPGRSRRASGNCWPSSGSARVEYYARAAELRDGARCPGAGGGRDHGAHLPRDARPHRAGRLRRLLAAHPRATSAPDRHRRRHVDAHQVRPSCPGLTSSSSAPALPASARRCVWSRPARACSSSRSGGGWAAAPPRLRTRRPARSSTTASTRCLAAIARPSRFFAPSTRTSNVALDERLDIEVVDRHGTRSRLVTPPWAPPLAPGGRAVAMVGARVARPRGRASHGAGAAAAVPAATAATRGRGWAAQTAEAWLIECGQTPRLRELLWEPLVVAALNQSPATAAAAPFARVLTRMFNGTRSDAAIGLPRVPLDALYAEPARRWLEARGSSVRDGHRRDAGGRRRTRRGGRSSRPARRGRRGGVVGALVLVSGAGAGHPGPGGACGQRRPDGRLADCDRQSLVRPHGDRHGVCRPAGPDVPVGVRQGAHLRRHDLAPVAGVERRRRRRSR